MLPPARKQITRLVKRASELCRLPLDGLTVGVVLVGDRTMARINREFVGHEGTTDVITFNYMEAEDDLASSEPAVELIVGVDVALREGLRRKDSSYARELTLYIVHGLLHSAGEDDLEPADRKRMRLRERQVMKQLEQEFNLTEIFPLASGNISK
ncbi:MAG: rRNA maturation RNase YbeY [Victivallaceae bacterium]